MAKKPSKPVKVNGHMTVEMVGVGAINFDPANVRRRRPFTGEWRLCGHCGQQFYVRRCEVGRLFCSHGCSSMAKRKYPIEQRTCAHCSGSFMFSLKPHSNNAGKFCSLACRNGSYVGKYHGKPLRSYKPRRWTGWRTIRDAFVVANNDFCAMCGRRDGRLQVHHIEPFRVAKNNGIGNLVTVCPKHHGKLEIISERIADWPKDRREIAVAMIQAAIGDNWHIHQGRRLAAQ